MSSELDLSIEDLPFACATHKILLDDRDKPIDYIFLDANKEFEKMTGLQVKKILGINVLSVLPDISQDDFDWIGVYGGIALNGGSKEFVTFSKPLNRWFKIKVFSNEKLFFTTIFLDVSFEHFFSGVLRKFNEYSFESIDYQSILDDFLTISGASYAAFNLLSEQHLLKTVALSGIGSKLKKLINLIGFDIFERDWNLRDSFSVDNDFDEFPSFSRLVEGFLPSNIAITCERVFSLGNALRFRIFEKRECFGELLLFYKKEKSPQDIELLRRYVSLVSILLKRIDFEKKAFFQNDILINNIHTQLWYLKDPYTYGIVNKSRADFFNTTPELMNGQKISKFMKKEVFELCLWSNKQVFNEKTQLVTQEWVDNGDGNRRLLKVVKTPKLSSTGEVYAVICTAEDVTSEWESANLASKHERWNEALMGAMDDLIFVLSSDLTIKSVHVADVTKILYDNSYLIGKKFPDIPFQSPAREEIIDGLERVLAGELLVRVEYFLDMPNGTTWYDLSITAFSLVEGEVNLLGVARDITRQKEVEFELQAQKDMLSEAEVIAKLGRWDYNHVEELLEWSDSTKDIFGEDPNLFFPNLKSLFSCVYPADSQQLQTGWELSLLDMKTFKDEFRIVLSSGDIKWLYCQADSSYDSLGKPLYSVGIIQDITYRKNIELALESNQRQYQNLVENIPGAVFICENDNKWTMRYVSDGIKDISGYESASLQGNRDLAYVDLIHREDKDKVSDVISKMLDEKKMYKIFYRIICKDNQIKWVAEYGQGEYDLDGKIICIDGLIIDITEQKRLEDKILELSIKDPLLDIYNRRYFFEKLDNNVDKFKRTEMVFSVAIIDLDLFKFVNDSYGHLAGDFVLKEVAYCFLRHLRSYDVIARYGGEEFIIFLDNMARAEACRKIEDVLALVSSKDFIYNNNKISVTFSGGVCDVFDFEIDEISSERITEKADKRLYQAKTSGRNRIVY
ncbi:MAG: diguanylate cyclase [Spirochaetales bacterium]|nr:diguanylate cyclase [Spirochaetales bacterium]